MKKWLMMVGAAMALMAVGCGSSEESQEETAYTQPAPETSGSEMSEQQGSGMPEESGSMPSEGMEGSEPSSEQPSSEQPSGGSHP